MAATDREQFEQLLTCRHPCVRILTYEEEYALSVVRNMAMDKGVDVWLWSISSGLRDGMIENGPTLADTDHPAAALYRIAKGDIKGIFVFLDLVGARARARARVNSSLGGGL